MYGGLIHIIELHSMNVHDLIRRDHEELRDSYAQFETAEGEAKEEVGTKLLTDLTVHAIVEEELYYPEFDNAGEGERADEYRAEHAAVKAQVARLSTLGVDDPEYGPSMKALMESVEPHMEEEETTGFPAAEAYLSEADLERIGTKMEERKGELEESTIKRLWATLTS